MLQRSILALALTLAAATAAAADIEQSALEACRAERDDDLRLACYDRVVGRTSESPIPPAQVAEPAPPSASAPAAPPPATPEDRFGRERAIAREQQERARQETREIGELNALVSAIETRIDGLMIITLDNGQVWRQNRADSMFRLKVGDAVKIQPGALKSFLMSGPSNRSTRVTRVR